MFGFRNIPTFSFEDAPELGAPENAEAAIAAGNLDAVKKAVWFRSCDANAALTLAIAGTTGAHAEVLRFMLTKEDAWDQGAFRDLSVLNALSGPREMERVKLVFSMFAERPALMAKLLDALAWEANETVMDYIYATFPGHRDHLVLSVVRADRVPMLEHLEAVHGLRVDIEAAMDAIYYAERDECPMMLRYLVEEHDAPAEKAFAEACACDCLAAAVYLSRRVADKTPGILAAAKQGSCGVVAYFAGQLTAEEAEAVLMDMVATAPVEQHALPALGILAGRCSAAGVALAVTKTVEAIDLEAVGELDKAFRARSDAVEFSAAYEQILLDCVVRAVMKLRRSEESDVRSWRLKDLVFDVCVWRREMVRDNHETAVAHA